MIDFKPFSSRCFANSTPESREYLNSPGIDVIGSFSSPLRASLK